ncbi:hypothetical protein ACFJ8P_004529, partial [Escherichia coli]
MLFTSFSGSLVSRIPGAVHTAGIDNTKVTSERPLAVSKAKPVSISFFEENLKDIDDLITGEMISGKSRVNRSDVVRAAVEALKS